MTLEGRDVKVIVWLTDQTPGALTVEFGPKEAITRTAQLQRVQLDFKPAKVPAPKATPAATPAPTAARCEALFRVYVVLATGNEKDSSTLSITRTGA